MTLEIATGRAKCSNCGEQIPEGASCIHLAVNSRAAPFLCARCVGQFQRLVEGQTSISKYELWEIDGEYLAKKSGEDGWLCDIQLQLDMPWGRFPLASLAEIGAIVGEQIALAEGVSPERSRLLGPQALQAESGQWVTVLVFELEI
jgi:hypothetical protein